MFTYPYDPHGNDPENAFEERFILDSTDTNLRTVVLKHRPFFEGVELYLDGGSQPLVLGSDYEYAYSMPELDESVARPVHCGITFINKNISGSIRAVGQHLGSDFYDPIVDILDYLIKQLNNPVDVSWLNTLNRPALMPPTQAATSWADLLNKKYLASAITDLNDSVVANDSSIDEMLAGLAAAVNGLYDAIVAFDYPAHASAKNPHNETALSIGAHGALAAVPDTVLLYGKTLRDLTAAVRARGLTQADVNRYIEKWSSRPAQGVITQMVAPNRPLFKTPAGETELTFTDTSFTVKSNGDVVLAVGTDYEASNGNYVEWVVGANRLRIESTGNSLNGGKLTLNGISLLNVRTLMGFQDGGGQGGGSANILMEGIGINFTGLGTIDNPITAELVVPRASTTAAGGMIIRSAPSAETGAGISTDALQQYRGNLDGYVPKTATINGKPMTGAGIVITLTDIHLGSVDNTADMAKPISGPQQAELNALAAKSHKHDWETLAVPNASPDVLGAARVATSVVTLEGNKAVSPSVMLTVASSVTALEGQLINADPRLLTDYASVATHQLYANADGTIGTMTDVSAFYSVKGVRRQFKITGTVDFQTTPMFNWMSPYNNLEDFWPRGDFMGSGYVLPVAAYGSDLDSPGTPVTVNPGEMGGLNIQPYLVKEWVRCSSGKLRIRVSGNGIVQVYLDGVALAGGGDNLVVQADVTTDEAHCVAISCACTDTTKSLGIWFDIMDDRVPVAWSSPRYTRIGRLTEFCPFYNTTHYLYVNLETGGLYTRAEPIFNNSVTPTAFLLGARTFSPEYTYGNSATIPFQIDIGPVREVTNHQLIKDAHHINRSTFTYKNMISNMGLPPSAQQHNQAHGNLLFDATKGDFVFGRYAPWGYTLTANPKDGGSVDMARMYNNVVMQPSVWFTPNNPLASNHFTMEGCLLVEAANQDKTALSDADVSSELIFRGAFFRDSAKKSRAPLLRIFYDNVEWAVGENGQVVSGWLPVAYTDLTTPEERAGTYGTPETLLFPPGVDTTKAPHRAVFHYRYDVDTNTLVVLKDWLSRNFGVYHREVRRYKFGREITEWFLGVGSSVGVRVISKKPSTVKTLYGYVPFVESTEGDPFSIKMNDFRYLPSLVEGFGSIGRSALPATSNRLMKYTTATRMLSMTEFDAKFPGDGNNAPSVVQAGSCQATFIPHAGGFVGDYNGLAPYGLNADLVEPIRGGTPTDITLTPGTAVSLYFDDAVEIPLPLTYSSPGMDSGVLKLKTSAACMVYLDDTQLTSVLVPGDGTVVDVNIPLPARPSNKLQYSAIRILYDKPGQVKFGATWETVTGGNVSSYEPTTLKAYPAGKGTMMYYFAPYGTSRAGFERLVADIAKQRV